MFKVLKKSVMSVMPAIRPVTVLYYTGVSGFLKRVDMSVAFSVNIRLRWLGFNFARRTAVFVQVQVSTDAGKQVCVV